MQEELRTQKAGREREGSGKKTDNPSEGWEDGTPPASLKLVPVRANVVPSVVRGLLANSCSRAPHCLPARWWWVRVR